MARATSSAPGRAPRIAVDSSPQPRMVAIRHTWHTWHTWQTFQGRAARGCLAPLRQNPYCRGGISGRGPCRGFNSMSGPARCRAEIGRMDGDNRLETGCGVGEEIQLLMRIEIGQVPWCTHIFEKPPFDA